jgi:hypothetical protein
LETKIFIQTENLGFFYILNKELKKFGVKFKILNFGTKIPKSPAVILTTSNDFRKLKVQDDGYNFLVYPENGNFNEYIIRVISAYRIGFKESYNDLIFSVDPGNKTGLMVFLDNFYLISHCCYEKTDLLKKIKDYVDFFQKLNPEIMNLTFKFGIGVFHITKQLLSHIFKIFDERENLKIFLINEFRSSKLKIRNKKKGRKISKDEMSALILALRDGIEVNKENYHKILQNKEFKKLNKEQIKKEKLGYSNEKSMILKEIAVKLLNNELSLSESRKKLRDYNLKTHNFSLK